MKKTLIAFVFLSLLWLYARNYIFAKTVIKYSEMVNGEAVGSIETIEIPVRFFDCVSAGDTTWMNISFDKLPNEAGVVPKKPNNMVYEFSTAKGKGKDLAQTKKIVVQSVRYSVF